MVVPTPSKEQTDKADANIVDLAAVTILLKEQTNFGRTYSSDEKGKGRADPPPPTMARYNRNPFQPADRWIRFQIWFNTYKKFWVFIVSLELAGMIAAGAGKFPYAHNNTGGIIIGNILAGVVVRNELFGRLLYIVINGLFAKWTPLWWRLGCSSVLQHLGGIHSGCSVSAIGWLIYNLVELFRNRATVAPSVLGMGVVVLVIITFTSVSAIPWVRNTHHNVFERNHRFFGWLSVLVTWVYIIVDNGYRNSRTWGSHSYAFAHHQELWLSVFMALAVALPWTYTRKVPIHVELPSQKVAILRFERGMQQGLLGRISRTAFLEYHVFGIVSASPHSRYHYMICGVQGDFTRKLVQDMPTHIWTREVKFAGVGNTSTLYKRGIRICTGTGIGAALSTCLQSDQWFLIWIGSDVEATFGPTISGLIERGVGHRAILWDTKKFGRPNTMELLAETYTLWNAEVVFITSNWEGNQEMMQGCKMRGIPAFGTLWDF